MCRNMNTYALPVFIFGLCIVSCLTPTGPTEKSPLNQSQPSLVLSAETAKQKQYPGDTLTVIIYNGSTLSLDRLLISVDGTSTVYDDLDVLLTNDTFSIAICMERTGDIPVIIFAESGSDTIWTDSITITVEQDTVTIPGAVHSEPSDSADTTMTVESRDSTLKIETSPLVDSTIADSIREDSTHQSDTTDSLNVIPSGDSSAAIVREDSTATGTSPDTTADTRPHRISDTTANTTSDSAQSDTLSVIDSVPLLDTIIPADMPDETEDRDTSKPADPEETPDTTVVLDSTGPALEEESSTSPPEESETPIPDSTSSTTPEDTSSENNQIEGPNDTVPLPDTNTVSGTIDMDTNVAPVIQTMHPAPEGTISLANDLSWEVSDPEGDALIYTLYLGVTETNLFPVYQGDKNRFNDGSLLFSGVTYFWRLEVSDGNTKVSSQVHTFSVD